MQLDIFVLCHLIGWFIKALIIRDYSTLWILSIMFEVCEYSLAHHLPNFAECWWDHWILDVAVCNYIGIWYGLKFLKYLKLKPFHWTNLHTKKSNGFDIKRYVILISLIVIILIDELCLFYLKSLFWVPPSHWIIFTRTLIHSLIGATSINNLYDVIHCKKNRLDVQTYVTFFIILIELFCCLKFGQNQFLKPFPKVIKIFWIIFVFILFIIPITFKHLNITDNKILEKII